MTEAVLRNIEGVYPSPALHWVGDGFRVAGYFSSIPNATSKLSPFLLLDYHPEYAYAPSETPRGVGVHPHRGFETVTLAFQGSVAHHDSTGAGGVIGPGDVQWMTAASGVLHKEYHEQNYARRGGPFQMVQLWVNLPKAHKMGAPRYQHLAAAQMGHVDLPNNAGHVRVIAGQYQGVRGPAQTYSPVHLLDARLVAGAEAQFDFPARHNLAVLVLKGQLTLQGNTPVSDNSFVVLGNSAERLTVRAETDAQVLILGGEPIAEPVVQYGPFVMNTPQEIRQAFADLSQGKFGTLAD